MARCRIAAVLLRRGMAFFKRAEHFAAFGYAVSEFVHLHQIVLLAAAVVLGSVALIAVAKAIDMGVAALEGLS